jgi:hypothetical protein
MSRSSAYLVLLLVCSGCAVSKTWIDPQKTPPVAPAAFSDEVDVSLFLIGDAGNPLLDRPEPVLEALVQQASPPQNSTSPQRSWIVFLGDNIYPDGVPENPESGKRRKAEAALHAQLQAAQRSGAETIFLPGNHDHHSGGLSAVERQAEIIAAFGDPRIRLLPEPGCPGPEILDVGETLRLVLLDSEWWIASKRRGDTPTQCAERTPDSIVASIEAALDTSGDRHTIVLAHHPLVTHGAHGGFFSWREHLFPLVRWKSWCWVPIPVLSSMYVGVRKWGGYAQDLGGTEYKEMKARLTEAFATRPPLLHAAGHEHSLQVLEGSHQVQWNLVSGAGTVRRPDEVGKGDDTVFVSPRAGFMRVDLLRDGRVRLDVVEVTRDGAVFHPFSVWLTEERTHAAAR